MADGPRVLALHGSEVLRRVLRLILQGEGYHVHLAATEQEAVAAIPELCPDVIVADEDALAGAEDILDAGGGPIPLVVLCSGRLGPENMRHPPSAYVIAKPFDMDTLVQVVGTALGARVP